MRTALLLFGLLSCANDPAHPAGAPSGFELKIAVAPNLRVDQVVLGSATYVQGDIIHFDKTYGTFEESVSDGSNNIMQIMHGSDMAETRLGPDCLTYGTPYLEVDQLDVFWDASATEPRYEAMGSCYVGSDIFGWSS
ncbi:MAG TPA: hypothetical protein VGL61_09560 [Kofleriaceae bacterium]|jgi:hypothetical protein